MRIQKSSKIQPMCMLIYALVVLFKSFSLSASGQQYYFKHLSTESGLSHNCVHAILQDSRGFLWFGTSDGLNRYDGVNLKTFYKYDFDINSCFIITLCEDNLGNIWLGTDNGVTVYDLKNDRFKSFSAFTKAGFDITNKVPLIRKDEQGIIWIAANHQGLISYNPETGDAKNYFVKDGVQTLPANITSVYFDNNNTCWLGLYFDNLYSADKQLETVVPYTLPDGEQPYLRDNVTRIIKSPYNSIYVSSVNRGVDEINLSLNAIKPIIPNPDRKFITNDLFLSNNDLWVATSDGLYKYNVVTEIFTHITSSLKNPFSVSDTEILSIAIDDLKGIWLGTYSAGVNFTNQAFMSFEKFYKTSAGSLEGNLVRGFVEDKNGLIWIGTEKAGLFRYSQEENALEKYENSSLPDNIYGICCENGNLWMGSYSGIYRLNVKTNQIKVYSRSNAESTIRDNKIYKIYKNSLNHILVGTTLGLLKYDEGTDDFIAIHDFDGVFIYDIFEDTQGNMWYATYANGLFKYDIEKKTIINYQNDPSNPHSIPSNKILSVFEDSKNRIWITTHGAGFCLLNKDDTFTTFDVSNGMPNNIIYKILEDEGDFWISSNKGLIKFSPEKKDIKIYTAIDGLLNNEFNYNSGVKTSNGDLFFGSKDGFIKFNPKNFIANQKVPNIVITDFLINGKPVKPNDKDSPLKASISETRRIELTANQNSMEFKFSILNFLSPTNNILYYRLDGYNDEWQKMSSEHNIAFNKLPAGKYLLQIKGVSSDGIWNEEHPPVEIIVSPRFYESTLAIILYIIAAIATILLIVYYQQKRTIEQQQRKQKIFERNREIELYNEKIDFFSNIAHEIKTPLTLIRTPLENIMNLGDFDKEITDDLNLINHNTRHLSQLISELLDFSKVEKKGFQLSYIELDIIEKIEFLTYNFNSFAKNKNLKLSFIHELEHIYIFADEQGFVKIFNNVLSNALKYAETYIEIIAGVTDNKVSISVKNDGPIIPLDRRESIFQPFVQYKDPGNIYTKGFGIGLSLARTLAELHSGSLIIDDDLSCSNFILTLPLLKITTENENVLSENEDAEEEKVPDDQPVILLVEDNVDLLKYTKRKIRKHYSVLTAVNGKAALDIINEERVDIIVTDISMPEMDGLQMCEQLKINFETSHIPIIILSARSSMQSKIASMEYGADIYIEKPFSLEFLISCIDGLLLKRRNLRDAYGTQVNPTPKQASLSKRDEEFLITMDEIILANMSDPDFCIEQLAEHLCLSKSTLNRKIKGLLHITPNEYIKTKRLIMAAELLAEGSNQINETCYMVGFSTPSYFIKCFKNYFGRLPTEYKEEKAG